MAKRGKVKWFSNVKGYGFIEQEDGDDAFVHYSDIVGDEKYKTLEEGENVEYELQASDDRKGPKAVNVVRLGQAGEAAGAADAAGPGDAAGAADAARAADAAEAADPAEAADAARAADAAEAADPAGAADPEEGDDTLVD